jgi:hypothetical protein
MMTNMIYLYIGDINDIKCLFIERLIADTCTLSCQSKHTVNVLKFDVQIVICR